MATAEIPDRYRDYAPEITLGCANFRTAWGDKATNLENIKRVIGDAVRQGVQLLVFPELALSGYECGDQPCMHEQCAETIPGPATEEIGALARRHGIYIVFGMPERDPESPARRYIACALVGPEGLVGSYRKLHLGPPPLFTETRCFRPGAEIPVFDTVYGPIGIQICADFWMYPEIARIQMLKGARVIINCSGSPDLSPGRREYMTQQTGARATENLVYAASCNLVGRERTLSFYGCSTIAGPAFPRFNYIYAQAGNGEELVAATLSFAALHRIRAAVPVDEIRRDDVLLREFQGLTTSAAAASGRHAGSQDRCQKS